MSTYNVFNAAMLLGIKRVVWASSETALGIPYVDTPPQYAPLDELHTYPNSSYALSKMVCEEIARQFHRWSGITFVGFRLSNIKRGAKMITMRSHHSGMTLINARPIYGAISMIEM